MRVEKVRGVKSYIFKNKKEAQKFLVKELKTLDVNEIIYLINEMFTSELGNHPITDAAWLEGEL